MKEQTTIENIISQYLNGECTESEVKSLFDWIDDSHQNEKVFFAIKDVWDASRHVKDHTEPQLISYYKNLLEKRKKSQVLFLRWAASVAAILLAALFTVVLWPSKTIIPPDNLQVISVPLGSRSKVMLADGTEINLNSGSELQYPSTFSTESRNVTLTGEAFFKVKSDKENPFIVKTKDFDVQVTGTQFNICSYNEDLFSSTTLAEGKISLNINGNSQPVDVKPGEKIFLARDSKKYSLATADMEQETAWKDGEFIFKNIPFPDLVTRLERWYDVKLTVSDENLTKFSYTGRFKNQETIWQVLDALKLTSPIDYKKTTFREFEIIYKPKTK